MFQEFEVGENGIPENTCAGCGKPLAAGDKVMAVSISQAKAGQVFHPKHVPDPDAVNPEPAASGESKSLADMSVKELKAEAKARGLKGYSKLKQAELVALLEG